MLVLTRKQNEKIRIGDDVTITVVRTKGKTVRLGIQAPPSKRVLRGEIAFEANASADDRCDDSPQDKLAADHVVSPESAQPKRSGGSFAGPREDWSARAAVRSGRRAPGAHAVATPRPLRAMVQGRTI